MTYEQFQTIQKVINKISPKHTFGYYTIEDIAQESFIICFEALEKYDGKRPLENFISKHLSNRLKTLKRDEYFRNKDKKKLVDTVSLSMEISEDNPNRLESDEALEKIMNILSPSMRNDFLKVANGVSIQSHRKNALFEKVREIIGEDWEII